MSTVTTLPPDSSSRSRRARRSSTRRGAGGRPRADARRARRRARLQERRADRRRAAQRPVQGSRPGCPIRRPASTIRDCRAASGRRGPRRDRRRSAAATTALATYNQLRDALGLAPQTSFTQITGESHRPVPPEFRHRPRSTTRGFSTFTSLQDLNGKPIAPGDDSTRAVYGTRASTLAARLKAIYGTVDNVDAFVGMLSEPHLPGTEFGELQLALWQKQFDGTARRRPVLLPQRPGARGDPAPLRNQLPAHARSTDLAQHRDSAVGHSLRGVLRSAACHSITAIGIQEASP